MWSVPDVKHVSGTYLDITGGSGEIRTRDQRIKSPLLYRLSYRPSKVRNYSKKFEGLS